MFRARLPLVATLISAIFIASILPANSASVAGTSCTKLNSTKTVSNIKYTCVKSGKKLVWNKGVALNPKPIASKSPDSIPSPAPTATQVETQPFDVCSSADQGASKLTSKGTLVCKKDSNDKMRWLLEESVPSPSPSKSNSTATTPAPSPTPTYSVVKLNFENLFENRSNISFTAWKNTAELIKSNKPKFGNLNLFTGPNTKPYFDDYPYALGQVSKMFPNNTEAKDILVLRFNYKDRDWAENKAKTFLSSSDYDQLVRWQQGPITRNICTDLNQNCQNSQQMTTQSGIAVILQGVEDVITQDMTGTIRQTTGMLEAHEYFHSLQRIPIMFTGVQVWPHAWWREGSAEWVQNMAVSDLNFAQYSKYLTDDCFYTCSKMPEADLEEFLNTAYDNYVPSKFDSWLNYSFGSHIIEVLVAINGPQSIIDMYEEVGKGLTFAAAFEKIYGISWTTAIPILSKTIYANLHNL